MVPLHWRGGDYVSIPVVVDEPSGVKQIKTWMASKDPVSIPVVVDEPSGGAMGRERFRLYTSQSLLSWMSPRAGGGGGAVRCLSPVSIPVVVDEPSGGESHGHDGNRPERLNPCCRG